jgi:hypothetical protein
MATGQLRIAKANQFIQNFQPAAGSRFAVGGRVQLTAQASSGLPVQYATLDDRIAQRNGSTLTFVNPGRARDPGVPAGRCELESGADGAA